MSETFIEFPKIARLSRECVITEKLDGTNGLVEIVDLTTMLYPGPVARVIASSDDERIVIFAGSRTKYITPEDDNYGFARWVKEHAEELLKLGPGRHFGEWWGQGIQRKYGLTEKRWSLFNTSKWTDEAVRPSCCHVVPVLAHGLFTTDLVEEALNILRVHGSAASNNGFMNPEGVIAYHVQGNIYFKKTLSKDEEWKGKKP